MASQAAGKTITQGVVLGDTYEITRLIGEGGMGAVWEARHRRLEGKHVAIKVLHADVAAETESVARFRREAQIASRLGHPNIVEVHDFNTLPDGTEYLILELLRGESLAARLVRGPLPLQQVFDITRQIGSALQAAHSQGIIHRDLKPQNIFLCPTDARGYVTEQAKVLDFGISKIRGSQTIQTQATSMLGTPQYMAPEQATGNHDAVDARTDVFALGSIVYEMLSGKPAFTGTTIPEVVFKVVYEPQVPLSERAPHVPARVVDAVHRALEKNQDDRFPDVSAFVEALTGDPLRTFRGAATGPVASGEPGRATGALATGDTAYAPTTAPGFASALDPATARTMAPQTGPGPSAGQGPSASAGQGPSAATGGGAAQPGGATTGRREEAAFAQTMASGDYAEELAQMAARGAAAPTPAPAHAQDQARSSIKWIAVGGAAVILAVVLTVAVMQRQSAPVAVQQPGADAGAAVGVKDAGAAASADAGHPLAVGDKPGTTGDKPGTDKPGTTTTKPGTDKPGTTKPGPDKPGTTTTKPGPDRPTTTKPAGGGDQSDDSAGALARANAKKDLAEAKEFLSAGELERAIRSAQRSLSHARTDQALALLTTIYCRKRDLGGANSYFTQIRSQATRRKLIDQCAKQDILLD